MNHNETIKETLEKITKEGRNTSGKRTKIYNPGDTVEVYVNGKPTKVKIPSYKKS